MSGPIPTAATVQAEPDDRIISVDGDDAGMSVNDMLVTLRRHLALLIAAPLAAGALALGITYLVPPTFTASTTFMPPQQSQSGAASALASLGPLAALAGGAAGVRSSGDQYVSLMQSVTVSDRLIDQFKLMQAYDSPLRIDARKELGKNVRITLGKKDGLIIIEVDDTNPQRAADIANRYVDELRRVTAGLAVTEAQQRRLFFEQHLRQSRDQLAKAQQALQTSGFNPGALKAEPKAAAEGYAKLKSEVTAAEVRLQVTRGTLTEIAPEVRQQQATVNALRERLAQTEHANVAAEGPDYISRYREFKYQEALFELYARQFELARVDESREGAMIQVIDPATAPERKSKPRRGLLAGGTVLGLLLVLAAWVLLRRSVRQPALHDAAAPTG